MTMSFIAEPPTRQMWVLAQDPTIVDEDDHPLFTRVTVPNERLTPGPKSARLHIVDYDSSLDKLIQPVNDPAVTPDVAEEILGDGIKRSKRKIAKLLSNPDFHAQNCYALVANTMLQFETALGRSIKWGFEEGGHQIKISPHAFSGMNAFYSRADELLAFGYFPQPREPKKFVFTCLSHDIVVHECVHAILDGLRTEYMRPSSIDQGGFHEGFSDIVALLSAFKSPELVEFALTVDGRGHKTILKDRLDPKSMRTSFLASLAEEFGRAVKGESLSEMRGGALRQSAAMEPDPGTYERERVRAGVHKFGEVLVAPVINAFLEIWWKRVQPLDPVNGGRIDLGRAVEEGVSAASHLLSMCIRALDYCPPVNLTYGDYLSALLTADRETVPDDSRYGYRDVLLASFRSYGIEPGSSHADGIWEEPHSDVTYGFHGHAEMTWDSEALFRFLWENAEELKLNPDAFTKIVSVRPVVRHSPNGFLVRETVVEYLQILHTFASGLKELKIKRPKGMVTSEYVRLYGGGTLVFNDYGRLKYHIGSGVASPKEQTRRLQSLWDLGGFDADRSAELDFASIHQARALGEVGGRRKEQW